MTNRGGKREGAGRPALSPDEKRVRVWAFLTVEQIAALKAQGNGNLSEGIRRVLALKGETR